MNRNAFIASVLPSPRPTIYPTPMFSDKSELNKKLIELGLDITIGEPLKGGTVSQVYEATLGGKKVVVKHVDNLIPFDPTEFYIDKNGFQIDVRVLGLLSGSKVRVPKVINVFPEINTVVMEDLRQSGFTLLNDQIVKKNLNLKSALGVGQSLAELAIESKKFEEFQTNESAEQSIYERGLELRLAYPNSQKQYLFLEKQFVEKKQYFCWPDGHPKNILINDQGECTFIDFGRCVWADQDYMLPNFLAHIAIYSLSGYIKKTTTADYIKMCLRGYKEKMTVDEEIFCQYLAMEVLHRANGKWITGVDSKQQKLDILNFGLTVFDDNINSVEKLLDLLKK